MRAPSSRYRGLGSNAGACVTAAIAAALVSASLACGSPRQWLARDDFARSYACPADRIEVRARPDLADRADAASFAAAAPPPPEIASDPERLRVWEANARAERERERGDWFEVVGCGHDAVFRCRQELQYHCREAPAP